jgi:hypothetical protein
MPYAWFFGRKDDDKYQGFEESIEFLKDVMIKQVRGHVLYVLGYMACSS